jgi:acyl-coenzyme A thioesterase PaaI-like protein
MDVENFFEEMPFADYLEAGTGDLRAEADVVRCGSDVGVVDVDVFAEDGDTQVADARGVYKTG